MRIRVCIDCGCTDNRACVVGGVPCHWVSLRPPICSACQDKSEQMDAQLRRNERRTIEAQR